MKLLHLFILIMLLLLLSSCSEDEETTTPNPVESVTTTVDLVSLFTDEVVGTSELVRTSDVIKMTVVAHDLIPGHIYNLVCGVYNKPEFCEGICDAPDFQNNNEGVEGVSFLMTGKEASSTTETFTATLREGDVTSFNLSVYARLHGDHGGLQDAQKGTVNVLIRSQGPSQSGQGRADQISTFSNACFFNSWNILDPGARIPIEEGECALIYDSQHVAPQ